MRRWDRLLDIYMDEYRGRGVSEASIAYTESRLGRWGRGLKKRRPRVSIEDIGVDLITDYIVDPEKVILKQIEGEHLVPWADQAEQKNAPKSSEELLEVHRGGCQDRVDLISSGTLQPITFQPVFVLQMSDAWFDRGAAFHPSPSCFGCTSSSSLVDMHGDRTVIVVATIAHIDVHFAHLVGDQACDLLHLCSQSVAIVGISREALRADEPSTTTAYRDTYLVAELILLARLALGDTLDFRFMHRVDLVLVLPSVVRRFDALSEVACRVSRMVLLSGVLSLE